MNDCKSCRFFHTLMIQESGFDDTVAAAGFECRRYAPRMICGAGTGYAQGVWWPRASPDDWCGEFEDGKELRHGEDG